VYHAPCEELRMPMVEQRSRRISLIVSEDEQRQLRLAAAVHGISLSEFGREVLTAFARGQLAFQPRLPGVDAKEAPSWLALAKPGK